MLLNDPKYWQKLSDIQELHPSIFQKITVNLQKNDTSVLKGDLPYITSKKEDRYVVNFVSNCQDPAFKTSL